MNNRSIILVAASVAALAFGASSASAQEPGDLYATFGVGQTSIAPSNGNLNPEGTIIDARIGDVLFSYDGWAVAAEAGATFSNASASENGTFCIDFDCDDVGTWTDEDTSKWSGSLGVVVSRPVGPVVVSGTLGVRVSEYTRKSNYDYDGFSPNESYEDTAVAFGAYYGVRVDYPLTDRWLVGIGWERSDLVQTKWSGTFGSSERGFEQDTWTAGIRRKF